MMDEAVQRVIAERARRNWSARHAAQLGRVANTTWSGWERDGGEPKRAMRAAVARAFEWPADWFENLPAPPTPSEVVSLADVDRKLDDLSAQVTSDIAAATEAVAELLAAILRRLPDRPSRARRSSTGDRQSQPSAG